MEDRRDRGVRRHFSYANVMSTLAVFLVIAGGTAIAASMAAKNTVNSKSVKNESLRSKDLKDGKAVRSSDVIDGSLTGGDVLNNSLTGGEIDEATLQGLSASPTGPARGSLAGTYPNPTLAPNSVGTTQIADESVTSAKIGANQVGPGDIAIDAVGGQALAPESVSSDELLNITLRQVTQSIPAGAAPEVTSECANGEQLISGGAYASNVSLKLVTSGVDQDPNIMAWSAIAHNTGGSAANLTVGAYCLEF